MKTVLYLTDNIAKYHQGNYYRDWFDVVSERFDVTASSEIPKHVQSYDLIVIGHSYFNVILKEAGGAEENYHIDPVPMRTGLRTLGRGLFNRLKNSFFPINTYSTLKCSKVKKIFLSANDYKYIPFKSLVAQSMGASIVVTHTRGSVGEFIRHGSRTVWIPFSVKPSLIVDKNILRDIDIGFKANRMNDWHGGERENFYEQLLTLNKTFNCDLAMSEQGENFLHGDEYYAWLSSCKLIANSQSALGTVGTRFIEAMACGAVPLAPLADYEGLLQPNVHYVPVKNDYSDLNEVVNRFLTDEKYRSALRRSCSKFVKDNQIDSQFSMLLNKIKFTQ